MTEPELFSDGKAYERLMGRWSRVAGRAFLDWLDVPPGLRWLDVGCGNGAFTEELIARCAPGSVMAIDPSEGQIAYAQTRPGTEMAEFRVGDAQALPLADASFDVAVMALAISFVPNPAKAVAEMARAVRPGGWVATYMWDFEANSGPLRPLISTAISLGMSQPRAPSAAASGLATMRELWQAAGLQSIDSRVVRIPVTFASFDDFWASNNVPIGSVGLWIGGLAESAREQLRTRLREQLPTAPDGRISYEAWANAVTGRVPA